MIQYCNIITLSQSACAPVRIYWPTVTFGVFFILAKDFRIHFLVEMQGIKSRNFKRCILSAAIILLANRLSTDFTCNYSPMDQLRREFTSFLFTSRTVGPFMFDLNTNTNPNWLSRSLTRFSINLWEVYTGVVVHLPYYFYKFFQTVVDVFLLLFASH
jgi:hypothetical protein